MDPYILFKKLQEHEMELKILAIDEEWENKNRSIELKVEESDSNGDMSLIVKNFERFMRNEKKQNKEEKIDEEKDHPFHHSTIAKRKDTSDHIVP